jgi:hypothetical protein
MRAAGVLLVVSIAFGLSCQSAPAADGPGFLQLPGTAGCVAVGHQDGCTAVRGVHGDVRWSLSPDGRNLYGLELDGHAVAVLRQQPAGGFRQLLGRRGCLNRDGTDGCEAMRVLTDMESASLWLARDGSAVYLASDSAAPIRVVSLVRDRSSGALHAPARAACVASAQTAGCVRVAGLSAYDGVLDVVQSVEGQDVYVATYSSIVHLRRDQEGGIHRIDSKSACFAATGPACSHGPIPDGTNDAELLISDDARNLYARFSGHVALSGNGNVFAGAVLEFTRDPVTGALVPLAAPNACLSEIGPSPSCTAWSVVHAEIDDLAFASDVIGYEFSENLQEDLAAIVETQRDPATGAIAPAAAPSTCWGKSADPDYEPIEQSRQGEPCTRVREWSGQGLSDYPLITADGRNIYVLTESGDNFADLPISYRWSNIVEFARDPASGHLTRLPGRRGCLGAVAVTSCRRLIAKYFSDSVVEAAGGRALVLAISAPAGGLHPSVSLQLLARDTNSNGLLSPVRGRQGCAALERARTCQHIRGLATRGRQAGYEPDLETSPNGNYVYAERENVAILRVHR